jgi:hypothetical protein
MLLKIIIVALLVFMIYNLFIGMRHISQADPDSKAQLTTYLGRRLWLSVLAIALILLGLATGIITPNPGPFH